MKKLKLAILIKFIIIFNFKKVILNYVILFT